MQADIFRSSEHSTNRKKSLLLFFHGWGGDVAMLSHLAPSPEHDVMILSDYRDLSLNEAVLETIKAYSYVDVIAWSFGVWVAAHSCLQWGIQPRSSIAYNGTLHPVDNTKGIPIAIALKTRENLNEQHLAKFRQRMMGTPQALQRLNRSCQSRRDALTLRAELDNLYHAFNQPIIGGEHFFQHAVISGKDSIIPSIAQKAAWEKDAVATTMMDAPHFCFYHFDCWSELS